MRGRRRAGEPPEPVYCYRTTANPSVEDERMEEGLENLLNLLEGVGRRRSSQQPQDSPSDKLQYLSQLEMVARKLKHQLIQQTKVKYELGQLTQVEISAQTADQGRSISSDSIPR
jgi:hypothetical protein